MNTITELEALQNAANVIGLQVKEYIQNDKRKSIKKYFLLNDIGTVSPVLDYENMNHFILGWINCKKFSNPQ